MFIVISLNIFSVTLNLNPFPRIYQHNSRISVVRGYCNKNNNTGTHVYDSSTSYDLCAYLAHTTCHNR